MSDAPDNPEGVWDAGLRNEDIVALIACSDIGDGPVPAENPVYFSVRDLRDTVDASRLGPPKSASEGAERDREWPATVPSRPGTVESVTAERIVVMMEGDGAPARRQTYALNGKHAYVAAGDGFQGGSSIIAGVPRSQANLAVARANVYDPLPHIQSNSSLDRYAAVKALRFRTDLRTQDAGFAGAPVHVAILDKGQRSVKGLNSGSEGVVTLDLILTVRKPGPKDKAVNARQLKNGDTAGLIREAVAELSIERARNPSYVYAHVLTKAIQKHLVLDDLHLGDVLVALRAAGYAIDGKTGLLLREDRKEPAA